MRPVIASLVALVAFALLDEGKETVAVP